jgi:hypothetical protein
MISIDQDAGFWFERRSIRRLAAGFGRKGPYCLLFPENHCWEMIGERIGKNRLGRRKRCREIFAGKNTVGKIVRDTFMLVAVAGLDMKVYGKHLRKSELEQITKAVGAKLILLKGGKERSVWNK